MQPAQKLEHILEFNPGWVIVMTPDPSGVPAGKDSAHDLYSWTAGRARLWLVDVQSKAALADLIKSLNRLEMGGFPPAVKDSTTVRLGGMVELSLADFCELEILSKNIADLREFGPAFQGEVKRAEGEEEAYRAAIEVEAFRLAALEDSGPDPDQESGGEGQAAATSAEQKLVRLTNCEVDEFASADQG